jgi:hypothetical protein
VADFNPFSVDAQLATLIANSKTMHEANMKVQAEILRETKSTNGRVTRLEMRERYRTGWSAGVSLAVAAAWAFVTHLWK